MTTTALALARDTRTKLGQLVRLLSSDKDGEVVAAARAIGRTLRAVGKDFHDLAALIENPSTSEVRQPIAAWADMARFCAAFPARLTEREADFVHNMIQGPTCIVRFRTAVQTHRIAPLERIRDFRKGMEILEPMIRSAQTAN